MAGSPIKVTNPDGSVLTMPVKVISEASYTRLANTTAYTAADTLSNNTTGEVALTFEDCARAAGRGGRIVSASMSGDDAPSTAGDFTLLLFDTIPTATDDNTALSVSPADALNFIGALTFTADHKNAASTFYSADVTGLPLAFVTTDTADLFGLVQVDNAYTPKSGGVLTWRLVIEQD